MAKYVCDFEQVKTNGEKICKAASGISSAISTYSSKIDSSLSKWEGDAADSFENTNSSQVQTSSTNAKNINSFGEFIKEVAQNIEDLENELAGLNI